MRFHWLIIAFMVGVAGASFTGCAAKKPLLPVHDEILVYPLPYDLTYLRTLDALMNVQGWDLEVTDKENGLIRVRNIDFTGLDDSDQRIADFIVKRVNKDESSIELARESQQVMGSGDLMKAVSVQLNREVQS